MKEQKNDNLSSANTSFTPKVWIRDGTSNLPMDCTTVMYGCYPDYYPWLPEPGKITITTSPPEVDPKEDEKETNETLLLIHATLKEIAARLGEIAARTELSNRLLEKLERLLKK